jgi:hypothetical protein
MIHVGDTFTELPEQKHVGCSNQLFFKEKARYPLHKTMGNKLNKGPDQGSIIIFFTLCTIAFYTTGKTSY